MSYSNTDKADTFLSNDMNQSLYEDTSLTSSASTLAEPAASKGKLNVSYIKPIQWVTLISDDYNTELSPKHKPSFGGRGGGGGSLNNSGVNKS